MTAKSMDDLSTLTDMVDALVDESAPAPTNWSFTSAPSSGLPQRSKDDSRQPFRSQPHQPLPQGVVALPLEQCFFQAPRVKTPQPDNAASLTKLFVGNMRFEMTREALRWVFVNACGVDVPVTHVLVHVKSASNNGQPTGCASVYVSEPEAERLLEMNQRIFCSASMLYIAPSVEIMTKMIDERMILDVDSRGKKLRGPKNSMVVERSRATPIPTPTGSFTDMTFQNASFGVGTDSPLQPGSFAGMTNYSPPRAGDGASPPATPPLPADAPAYERYPLLPPAPQTPMPALDDAVELFVGGIRYEATRTFVAWMLTRALARRGLAVTIHDSQVRLFTNAARRRANNAGCAIIRLDRGDADKLLSVNHCVLCDANGAYFAAAPDAMQRFISTYQDKMRSGPSHAVVIEMRRSATTAPRMPQQFTYGGGPAGGYNGQGHTPVFGNVSPESYRHDERPPAVPSWMNQTGA
uniref:RRM domain-containing protein n=1 Tax=Neobodo designis TaxID=312471 RepID=A0A7S1M1L0_NEODS|mmetsp:Transcript_32358/g.100107  ORF Transcript_32358/g.100107 Transcript_32358/m.100107 type:complete len:466 (+) Transcript_32358:44-1441(+)|eukprot:CAMPEP_0174850448 /NCGR_PEP_ID=MMETSP1114-20130205/19416_1 /TAXON_ID=312471 /ORGANISM="Neobodo designis, Strain CCAP 1951/1" /LENGTH=465 /DNA_ID=CAMNT_0016084909 /DNA_START=42 /DNA_END=1439 /DNA_ORIENTATION=+